VLCRVWWSDTTEEWKREEREGEFGRRKLRGEKGGEEKLFIICGE